MTREERKQYAKEYRECGAGRMVDKAYRMRHLLEIRAKDRARKKHRREMG